MELKLIIILVQLIYYNIDLIIESSTFGSEIALFDKIFSLLKVFDATTNLWQTPRFFDLEMCRPPAEGASAQKICQFVLVTRIFLEEHSVELLAFAMLSDLTIAALILRP